MGGGPGGRDQTCRSESCPARVRLWWPRTASRLAAAVNAHDRAPARTNLDSGRISSLNVPEVDEHVARLYTSDVSGLGYVSHVTRLWANSPEARGALWDILENASISAGLDDRTRALLVTACALSIGDSYCSLAVGSRLAREAGDDVAAADLWSVERRPSEPAANAGHGRFGGAAGAHEAESDPRGAAGCPGPGDGLEHSSVRRSQKGRRRP